MAMGPFKSLNENYFQLGSGNDTTCDSATYVRLTNISNTTAYDIKVRTTANDDGTNVGRTIIAWGESFILKKEPAEFVHGSNGNVYASPISPRE
ncbi:virion protein [Synechococcus phage S-SCSM1]|uniref:Virion protein n=1 Tax=Synechococcus phage S-SCSM1 TaxID=2588487 RepID=A0A6M2ZIR7_9CAUD|nr:virion protein [Synechococcus phage S-SCSM1]QFG06295.1 virion protein [Synechococcus phage S-SCSM1]